MAETMAEGGPRKRVAAPQNDPFGARLFSISESLAVLGGLSLLAVTIFTVLSVVGRTGFDLPILGDQEIVELGCAIAIFAFMPYCQMRAANVIVDFFTAPFSLATRDFLDALMNGAFSACVLLVTWRLAIGAMGAFNAGDASMFLRIPLWWGYSFALFACVLWTLACFYSVVRSLRFMRLAKRASSGTGASG
jgi:TRAP-type C4-dicarboxylate transport system permease small subunit